MKPFIERVLRGNARRDNCFCALPQNDDATKNEIKIRHNTQTVSGKNSMLNISHSFSYEKCYTHSV